MHTHHNVPQEAGPHTSESQGQETLAGPPPSRLTQLHSELPGQDLTFFAGAPYVYHCHHFNLFHDQTVDDALGDDEGSKLRERAAYGASRQLLAGAFDAHGASTPAERLELSSALFRHMGHGRLEIMANETGGRARGEHLHYSLSWREKYGAKVRRHQPIDAFAAGFSAAAVELAFELPAGEMVGREEQCYACMDPACEFTLERFDAASITAKAAPALERSTIEKHLAPPRRGLGESEVETIARGLKDFLLGVEADERGLMQGFGVYITRHLSSYYNQTAYDTIHRVERERPNAAGVVEELFGESGHVCVFYTLGNILLSPEWEALVAPPSGDVMETIQWTLAACRGLGFGHWTLAELEPNKRLVLQASATYEAPFYLERYGRSQKARSYFLAASALAITRLAHSVDLASKPQLTAELYQSLFKEDVPWRSEITRCLTRGDELCEVVVEAASA